MRDFRALHQKYLINTYPFRGKGFEEGKGVFLYDQKGDAYLDLISGYGVNIFGHAHPKITKSLTDQIGKLTNLHASFSNELRARAAKKLVERCGGKLRRVYFSNSGSESVEAALKFAIVSSGKEKIIAMENSFHGKSLAALSVTYFDKYKKGVKNLPGNVIFSPYGLIEELEKIIKKEKGVGALIMEPIQGDGGVNVPPDGYLKEVEKLCKKNGILLILDEVQTGMGRTGYFLASQKEGVEPDILCLGKSLAGGIPSGATLVSEEVAQKVPKLIQTSTFGGNPLACRGTLEVIELLDEATLKKVRSLGDYFIENLKKIESDNIKDVRGRGLMIGVEVKKNRDDVLKNLQQRKILACPSSNNVVRFLPPFLIKKNQIKEVCETLSEVL